MRLSIMLIVSLAVSAICSAQTTWYVPDDYPNIQGAISDASVVSGDTVIVRLGTYVENIDFLGKAITLVSEQGADVTIIDGNQAESVVCCVSGEGTDSILEGFTITNGESPYGGGMYNLDSSPKVTQCVFLENEAFRGGGIYNQNSSPIVTHCTFLKNSSNPYGGGMYNNNNSNPTVIHCHFNANSASAQGGGMFSLDSNPIVTFCTFSGNTADEGAGIRIGGNNPIVSYCNFVQNSALIRGGGIFNYGSDLTLTNCNFYDNTAYSGGGIFNSSFSISSQMVTNCNFTGNTATHNGGGMFIYQKCHQTVVNTIFWNNESPVGPEIYIGHFNVPSTLTISYSDVKGGQSSIGIEPACTLNWGSGMIDSNPLFVDPDNEDFHLTFNSPCRGSGDNSAVIELHDFEGDPRIYQGTVDIGADEFHPHLYYIGDATPSGTIQAKFVGLPGAWIDGVIMGFNIFDPPLPCSYGLWYMDDPVQIILGLGTIPTSGVAVIPGTLPSAPPAPYTIYLQAAIDSWLTNLCTVQVQ